MLSCGKFTDQSSRRKFRASCLSSILGKTLGENVEKGHVHCLKRLALYALWDSIAFDFECSIKYVASRSDLRRWIAISYTIGVLPRSAILGVVVVARLLGNFARKYGQHYNCPPNSCLLCQKMLEASRRIRKDEGKSICWQGSEIFHEVVQTTSGQSSSRFDPDWEFHDNLICFLQVQ